MSEAVIRAVETPRSALLLCVLLGAAGALGQAPLGWAWVALAAFAAAIALLTRCNGWRAAAWRGWALGIGYFAASLFWIVEPFLVDVARHGWMAPFALLLMAGGLALFWALASGLAARLGKSRLQRALLLVVFLTAAEMLRSVILTGFPWVLVGHIWIGWPQMQGAAAVGAHGLTLLTLLAAATPTLLGARRAVLGLILGAALMSAPAGWAWLRVPEAPASLAEPPVTVRLVQPNATQRLKWDPDMIPVWFERQLEFTAAPSAEGGDVPDIVVWSETAVPWLLEHAEPAFRQMAEEAQGAPVVVGVQRQDDAGAWFNSLVVLDPDGEVTQLYDKHHLVPFGEYMPLMSLFAQWGVFGLASNETGGYAAGPGPVVLDLGPLGKALPLICYEAIFPNDIARAPERASWLMQITNDAWFGQLSGPYQHLALAQLRAVEQGLPLLRAANTGVSGGFDPYGRLLGQVPLGEAGYVDIHLPAPLDATPYARLGDAPVLFALLLLGLAALVAGRRPGSH